MSNQSIDVGKDDPLWKMTGSWTPPGRRQNRHEDETFPREDPPDSIAIELRDGTIINSETGNFTLLPSVTIQRVEKGAQKIEALSIELIDLKFTDAVPIFKVNEAPEKVRCHR